jgi:hypothetical protein
VLRAVLVWLMRRWGCSGHFGLWIDESLLKAASAPCTTFGNEGLAHAADFELKGLELWALD